MNDLRCLLYAVYTSRIRNGDRCGNPGIVRMVENVSTIIEKKSAHRV